MKLIQHAPRVRISSPLLSGLVFACVWLAAGAIVLSLLLYFSSMPEEKLSFYSYFVHLASSLAGGFVSGKRAGRRGWSSGALLGVMYALIIITIGFLAIDAPLDLSALLVLALAAAAGSIGGIAGVNLAKPS